MSHLSKRRAFAFTPRLSSPPRHPLLLPPPPPRLSSFTPSPPLLPHQTAGYCNNHAPTNTRNIRIDDDDDDEDDRHHQASLEPTRFHHEDLLLPPLRKGLFSFLFSYRQKKAQEAAEEEAAIGGSGGGQRKREGKSWWQREEEKLEFMRRSRSPSAAAEHDKLDQAVQLFLRASPSASLSHASSASFCSSAAVSLLEALSRSAAQQKRKERKRQRASPSASSSLPSTLSAETMRTAKLIVDHALSQQQQHCKKDEGRGGAGSHERGAGERRPTRLTAAVTAALLQVYCSCGAEGEALSMFWALLDEETNDREESFEGAETNGREEREEVLGRCLGVLVRANDTSLAMELALTLLLSPFASPSAVLLEQTATDKKRQARRREMLRQLLTADDATHLISTLLPPPPPLSASAYASSCSAAAAAAAADAAKRMEAALKLVEYYFYDSHRRRKESEEGTYEAGTEMNLLVALLDGCYDFPSTQRNKDRVISLVLSILQQRQHQQQKEEVAKKQLVLEKVIRVMCSCGRFEEAFALFDGEMEARYHVSPDSNSLLHLTKFLANNTHLSSPEKSEDKNENDDHDISSYAQKLARKIVQQQLPFMPYSNELYNLTKALCRSSPPSSTLLKDALDLLFWALNVSAPTETDATQPDFILPRLPLIDCLSLAREILAACEMSHNLDIGREVHRNILPCLAAASVSSSASLSSQICSSGSLPSQIMRNDKTIFKENDESNVDPWQYPTFYGDLLRMYDTCAEGGSGEAEEEALAIFETCLQSARQRHRKAEVEKTKQRWASCPSPFIPQLTQDKLLTAMVRHLCLFHQRTTNIREQDGNGEDVYVLAAREALRFCKEMRAIGIIPDSNYIFHPIVETYAKSNSETAKKEALLLLGSLSSEWNVRSTLSCQEIFVESLLARNEMEEALQLAERWERSSLFEKVLDACLAHCQQNRSSTHPADVQVQHIAKHAMTRLERMLKAEPPKLSDYRQKMQSIDSYFSGYRKKSKVV